MFLVRIEIEVRPDPPHYWAAKLLRSSGVGRAEMARLVGPVRAGTKRNALAWLLKSLAFEVDHPKKGTGRPRRGKV